MLAIAGGKGGTGKTTVALALARELAGDSSGAATRSVAGPSAAREDRKRAVTVVDADVDMPDAHAMAGVERTPTVLERPAGRPAASLPGVRIAPAPPPEATEAFERALLDLAAEGREAAPRGRVVVDAPCGAGPDAALPLAVADRVAVVTRPTPAAVRDTAKTAAMARALDTPVAAAVVVGDRPARSLSAALDVDAVHSLPQVAEDPLRSERYRASVSRLGAALAGGRHLFTE